MLGYSIILISVRYVSGQCQILLCGSNATENTGLLVLDDDNKIVSKEPVNQLGELCVYGSSLSAGYWDDTEKTEEKDIDTPMNKFYREKMYLTDDLVYYNERGELGEIESAAMGKVATSLQSAPLFP